MQDITKAEEQYHIAKFKNTFIEKGVLSGELAAIDNDPPSVLLNEVLKEYDCNGYQLASESNYSSQESYKGFKVDMDMKVVLNREGAKGIDFSELSSGERTLMALSMLISKAQLNNILPQVLLLDEIDASLHPSMIERMIHVIQTLFIEKYGMKVILATHSPTTVALGPKESIFVINNKSGQTAIQRQDKQKALDLLTQGMVVLNEEEAKQGIKYNLEKANPPVVLFTEGKTDQIIIETAWTKLNPDKKLNKDCPFYIESGYGASFLRTFLKNETNDGFIKDHPDMLFISLFDFDKAYDEWNGLGRKFHDIETNPRKCLTKKHQDGNAFCMLLPVPDDEDIAKEVLLPGEDKETFKGKSNLPIELMFCKVPKLKHLFSTQSTRGGGKEIVFKGNKTKFANKIADIDSEYFEVFTPLFNKINHIISEFNYTK